MIMPLSNSTFAFAGKLIDWTNRFKIISQADDDRKEAEKKYLKKSRYGSINYFISDDIRCKDKYNDYDLVVN